MRRLTPGTRPLLRTATMPALGLVLSLLGGCATLPPGTQRDARDPLERFNRSMFNFDDALVNDVARPVDKAWTAVTPGFVRKGLANVFANAHQPAVMVNDLLQGKLSAAVDSLGRMAVNTTFGVGGLLDVASAGRVPNHDNDFGRTLGTWGLSSGPYLVLPFYGPSTVRDAVGMVPDAFANPQHYIHDTTALWGTEGLSLLTAVHESVIPTYNLLQQQHAYDLYGFARNAYLQRREFQIHGAGGQNQDQSEQDLEKSLLEDSGEAPKR